MPRDYSLIEPTSSESNVRLIDPTNNQEDDDQLIIHSVNTLNKEAIDESIDRTTNSINLSVDQSNDELSVKQSINQSINQLNKLIKLIFLFIFSIILFIFIQSIYQSTNESINRSNNNPSNIESDNNLLNENIQTINQKITQIDQTINQAVNSTINKSLKQILIEAAKDMSTTPSSSGGAGGVGVGTGGAGGAGVSGVGVGVPGGVSPVEDNYLRVFNRWKYYCEDNNIVLNRGDSYFGRLQNDSSSKRIWTLNNLTNSLLDYRNNQKLPKCSSSKSVIDSIKFGVRIPVFNQPLTDTELHRSIFSPSGCAIEWLSSDEMCTTLNSFSHLILVGDSMQRHLIETFYAALTEDWRMGGLAPLSKAGLYDNCQCDGMYSEHQVCRDFASDNLYHVDDLRSRGVCYDAIKPGNRSVVVRFHNNLPGPGIYMKFDFLNYLCNEKDDRPRLLYIEGIWHYRSEVNRTIDDLIDPYFAGIEKVSRNCTKPFKYHLIFTGGHAQSRWLDARYPVQAREQMATKNNELESYVSTKWKGGYLDFWNLTRDAPSSDGLHHLTDSNLIKVQYLINYMKALEPGKKS